MRNAAILIFVLSLLLSSNAHCEETLLDLAVTPAISEQTPKGVTILVGGVVKEKKAMLAKLTGPYKTFTIWTKYKDHGFWRTSKAAIINDLPSYYQIFNPEILIESVANSDFLHSNNLSINTYFTDIQERGGMYPELLKHLQDANLFNGQYGHIEFIGQNFFQIHLHLPPNAQLGGYKVDVFTFDQNMILDDRKTLHFQLQDKETAFTRIGNALRPPLYNAMACISIAIIMGLLSSIPVMLFKRK